MGWATRVRRSPAEGLARSTGRPLDHVGAAHEASRPGRKEGPLPPRSAPIEIARHQPNKRMHQPGRGTAVSIGLARPTGAG
jgi:hypothetical protein